MQAVVEGAVSQASANVALPEAKDELVDPFPVSITNEYSNSPKWITPFAISLGPEEIEKVLQCLLLLGSRFEIVGEMSTIDEDGTVVGAAHKLLHIFDGSSQVQAQSEIGAAPAARCLSLIQVQPVLSVYGCAQISERLLQR